MTPSDPAAVHAKTLRWNAVTIGAALVGVGVSLASGNLLAVGGFTGTVFASLATRAAVRGRIADAAERGVGRRATGQEN